ncbi:extracellular solute-binding protein [Paenibacillus qinlingensis]|uniref:Aldouronate transport system substrate-binding protein n=1 Tax=Paenibacillus qinlingensis TaxID=1837343 RepID=A0ABU1NYV8_9BACL|nr:extracellular solute-binding protein [Paenibacillus qinlingensis]MDR6552261.1 putative aldouronate transport system substrate-binding protein [Paenibacillus qinlingensis]
MKTNSTKRVIALLGMVSLAAALATACSSTETKNPPASGQASASPVTLSLIQPDGGRVWRDDNPVTKEIEKKAQVKLNVNMLPNNDFNSKYNALAASGEIPDMSRLGSFDYQKFVDQGLFLDLTPYLNQYAPNLLKNLKPELWELTKHKGKQYVIPYENAPGKEVPVVRKDWLDVLNMKMPTNLDEFEQMLKAFTKSDPDKNGKDDTYGIGNANTYAESFMPIFGAFGISPGMFANSVPMNSYLKENKISPVAISLEYKAALGYIKNLWDAKVIDPEMFTIKSDQAIQKVAQGKIGYFNAWWSIAPQTLVQQLKMNEIVPNARWEPIFPGIKGPDGKSGMLSFGNLGGVIAISSKTKSPEAVLRFLNYMSTDEGWELSHYGIKGEHFRDITEARTQAGQKAFDERWLDPLSQIISRQELVEKVSATSKDPVQLDNNRFLEKAAQYTLYQDVFYGIPLTDEQKSYGPDVAKYEEEMFIKFVTGKEPLSKWEEYVATWKKKGGKALLESKIKTYNELRSGNVSPGI